MAGSGYEVGLFYVKCISTSTSILFHCQWKQHPFLLLSTFYQFQQLLQRCFWIGWKFFILEKLCTFFIQERRKKYFWTFLFTILLSHSHVSRPLITAIQLNTCCIAKMIPCGANQGNKQILHCFLAVPKSTNFSFSSSI